MIGPMALENDGGRPLFGQGVEGKEYSEKWASVIDAEVEAIMKGSLARATEVLKNYKPVLDAIAAKLMDVETLEQKEYEAIISEHGIALKKKEELA